MGEGLSRIALYLEYPFVRYAVIVGVLVALCSSLLGVTLVLKRFSFIGDGLSHVAFGAMAVASVLKLANQTALVLPVTVICAVLLLRTGQNAKLKGDAAIAMVSVGALAFGYLLMNVFPTSANVSGDVCSTLFGSTSILTLSLRDVWLCVVLSAVVIFLFLFFYHRIFDVTFDETFARSAGTRVDRYNLLIAVVIAVIVVLAMNLVGSLLISALVVFPALSAMRLFKSFRSVTVCSAVLSVASALAGLLISIAAATPVGSTIVAVDVLVFFVCAAISRAGRRFSSVAVALLLAAVLAGCGAEGGSAHTAAQTGAVEQVLADRAAEADAGDAASKSDLILTPESYREQADEESDEVDAEILALARQIAEESGVEDETALSELGGTDWRQLDLADEGDGFAMAQMPEGCDVDVDLTILNSAMVYAEVYNMMYYPEKYIGKSVRMEGLYSVYQDEETGKIYLACFISDAAACCQQGIEFELADMAKRRYPEDFPEEYDDIRVVGVYDTYEEDGLTYCTLRDAVLEEM